tara:strand:+ start:760 stop:1659 length:900 start_codon:yes stop_codon:yes gene_type:complete
MEKINFYESQKQKDPKQIFENLERYVDMVINRIQPSVLLTGGPGLGKTFMVKQRLDNKGFTHGDQYRIIKGSTTAAGLYRALYMNRGKIIVFDDCDSVFKDNDGVNLLKGALDSYDERWISWISGNGALKDDDGHPIPSQFQFTGSVIFISNLSQKKIDSAIRSRSFTVDIELTPEQLLKRMEEKLPEMEPKVPMSDKVAALKCLSQVYQKFEGVELNFRSLIKAIRIKRTGFDNWPQMVAEQCIDPNHNSSRKSTKKKDSITYTRAQLLAEKAKGKSWKTIEKELGITFGIRTKIIAG